MFVEPAETQVRALSTVQVAQLDAALSEIAADPAGVTPHATASALRDYQHSGVRIVFYATALGSILLVTYVEVD
ncbi:hypothetical protein [Streptomyces sp. NPDC058084]|uniref:hypothetical protein n=1 Tax=Streptomyces sp. NPDC058084 TaxID=3346333 RepID=UPI0036F06EA1